MWTVTKLAVWQQAQKMEPAKEKVAEERELVVAPAEINQCNYADVKVATTCQLPSSVSNSSFLYCGEQGWTRNHARCVKGGTLGMRM